MSAAAAKIAALRAKYLSDLEGITDGLADSAEGGASKNADVEDEDDSGSSWFGMFDLGKNSAMWMTLATVAALSSVWSLDWHTPTADDLTNGNLWAAVTSDSKALSGAYWPHSLMLTLHVFNSVGYSGNFWARDVVSATFHAYGGLMAKDLLAGDFGMPSVFGNGEALFSLVLICWFLRNHNLPFTTTNVWDLFSNAVSERLPLQAVMDLCSLSYTTALLIATAEGAGTAGANCFNLPAIGLTIMTCVAIHANAEFFNTGGLRFTVDSCSQQVERAVMVAVWCATNGLATVPVVGGACGGFTSDLEGKFGGRSNFLMSMILLDAVCGHLLPFDKPQTMVANVLYKITGISRFTTGNARASTASAAIKGPKAPYDLSDANTGAVATLLTVFAASVFWSNGGQMPTSAGALLDGSLWTSVTSDERNLNASWPFSLMLTLHVFNSVKFSGGYWAGDIVSSLFSCYGGLMARDLLAGSYTMPTLFANNEAYLSLCVMCWYLRNHNLPFTTTNLWALISDTLSQYFPLQAVMDLCSLSFNCSLLIATAMAAGTAGSTFYFAPALASTMFVCVAYHCAGDFFNGEGLSFSVAGCSDACERAVVVAFWCATDALGSFPVVGSAIGEVTHKIEAGFGGRATFLMSMILLNAVFGYLIKFDMPHTMACKALYKVFGVNDGSDDDDEAEGNESKNGDDGSSAPYDLSDANVNMGVTAVMVAGLSVAWSNGMSLPTVASLTDGSLFNSVTSDDKSLHPMFPFSLMLTMHVLNSVKSNGGYWVSDVVQCCFTAFGGLMMKDLLAGSLTMPVLFANGEAYVSLVLFCWYIVNHPIPFTKVNVWTLFSNAVSAFLPLGRFMDLCSLAFNSSLLIASAMGAGTAGNTFFHWPAVGATVTTCVALHCAGEFFSPARISFDIQGCSEACERAVVVAFWCATNGLATLPLVGSSFGGFSSSLEARFGGRANFLMMWILFDALAGHLITFTRPRHAFMDFLYKFTGVQRAD